MSQFKAVVHIQMLEFIQNSFIETQFNKECKKCIDSIDYIHIPGKPLTAATCELGTEASKTIYWIEAVIKVGDNKRSNHTYKIV